MRNRPLAGRSMPCPTATRAGTRSRSRAPRRPRRASVGSRNRSRRYARDVRAEVAASARGFILRHTRLLPVPGLEGIRLHLADEVLPLWRSVQIETKDPEAALPYWAF